jgi:hypothetical protein
MQAIFLKDEEAIKSFRFAVSEPRLGKYLAASNKDIRTAIDLYYWNAQLAQSLYITLQMWEIGLRNHLHAFLCWKYGNSWPFEPKCIRRLKSNDQRRLKEAISRQRQLRGIQAVPTDSIVADLSAGFWVSLLTTSYDVPFSWRYNLVRIFPQDVALTREVASGRCDSLLDLRNRVAHHEPIFHLPLKERRDDLMYLLDAMTPAAYAYGNAACTFEAVWGARPTI